MYSTVTGSSTVSRWLWHSTRALLMTILASAVRPAVTADSATVPVALARRHGSHEQAALGPPEAAPPTPTLPKSTGRTETSACQASGSPARAPDVPGPDPERGEC